MHRKYIGQIYTDSLVHDEEALKYLVSTVGEDRVILGSDYPFPLGEHHPGKLIDSVQDWDSELKVRRKYTVCVQTRAAVADSKPLIRCSILAHISRSHKLCNICETTK